MGQTTIGVGSALAAKKYSVALFASTNRKPSFRKNMVGPAPKQTDAERKLKNQTSPDYPFVRVTDLSKEQGESVSVDLFNIIQGKPVMGDKKLAGSMMDMTYSSQDIKINQARGGVDPGGRMSQQRTVHNLRKLALANLGGWVSNLEDQLCQVHIYGARGFDSGVDWQIPLETDPDFAEIMVNTVLPPTRNRRFFAGDATGVENIDSADILSLTEIDKFRVFLDETVHPLQPIKLMDVKGNMDPQADDNPLYCLQVSSRVWHQIESNTGATAWRTFLAAAHERSRGFNHPLFMGTVGMWNGILIKKTGRACRFPTGSDVRQYDTSNVIQTVQTAVDVDRSVLLGAQALAEVYGRHQKSGYYYNWHEEETDHGNTVEVSVAMMGGKSKLRFEVDGIPTDHGVITIDSYAVDPNA
jgi:N4-gp56 family major capsid protein